jgi:hypothetical protein
MSIDAGIDPVDRGEGGETDVTTPPLTDPTALPSVEPDAQARYFRSKRSFIITFCQASAKSSMNFSSSAA